MKVVKKRQLEKRTHFWGALPEASDGCQKYGAEK
jgi:hypothetical protein